MVYFDCYATPSDAATRIVPSPLDSLIHIVTFYGGAVSPVLEGGITRACCVTLSICAYVSMADIVVAKEDLSRWRTLRREARKLTMEHHTLVHVVESALGPSAEDITQSLTRLACRVVGGGAAGLARRVGRS